ncbi:MAG TPA: hypothetical protein VGR72_15245 [Candidatus Acidoferrales bacterium]|nr:hypothetical protein [Candidatus Acidoferrales bacterium]
MNHLRRSLSLAFAMSACFVLVLAAAPPLAAQVDSSLYNGMKWRLIGPYRAGRVTAVAGVPGNPAVFYIGTPGGGVWKTTSGGTVWKPIFDAAHVASIGAVTVAASNPNIIYVGTGEQTEGDGAWKSADAGLTWTHLGLDDTKFISSVIVDPRNPNTVLVGAMGDGKPGEARGVYKSTDGGKSWNKVLYKDDQTGIADMCADPENPKVVYAALWRPEFRLFIQTPGGEPPKGPDAWIYKSTDEGSTWKPLDAKGMPTEKWDRTGVAVAPGNHGKRVFAIVQQGLYRSDDAGARWKQITTDPRVFGDGYFSRVFVDPKNPDTVYIVQTCLYRSTDGGVNFTAFKGAPNGDDYHVLWIDPTNDDRMLLGVDQGAVISLDGGKTWSTWYNQPTGQLYHVSTDNHFPYNVYAAQQDSGSVAIPSRSDFGRIRDRDVFAPDGYEFGYIAADPVHDNLVYADGSPGTVVRLDRTTNQMVTVFIGAGAKYHSSANAPLLFSPQNPHTLYYGTQFILETTDGGTSWREISPDLTARPAPPAGAKPPASPRPGVITTLAPSPVSANVMWAGASDGLIQVTRDGAATWQNVSPPDLQTRSIVSLIDASPYDAATAYAAVDNFQDTKPYFYRTSDYGKTWQKINDGLPESGIARAIREDTVRKGLLYAGTETGVFVSFDDGNHWQSLQLNLPTCSVRDLVIHGDDLDIATYGRSLWILDDLTPLRQAGAEAASSGVYFYKPQTAVRVRWNNDWDTPLPPEVPSGENPPDGAFVDYYLKAAPQSEITLAIYDSSGNLVRQYTSSPKPEKYDPAAVPDSWFAPQVALPKNAGMNRFVWDLRYPNAPALNYGIFPAGLQKYVQFYGTEDAIPGVTPRMQPLGPQVIPGDYQMVLTVGGQAYRQTLHVTMDPRVRASQYDLAEQLHLLQRMANGMRASYDAYMALTPLHDALAERQKSLKANAQAKDAASAAGDFEKKFDAILNGNSRAPGFGEANSELTQKVYAADSGDGHPTEPMREAADGVCLALTKNFDDWGKFAAKDLPAFNDVLTKNKLAALPAPQAMPVNAGCGK